MNAREIREKADELYAQVMTTDASKSPEAFRLLSELALLVKHLATNLEKTESVSRRAENIASCLANGIKPD